MILKQMPYSLPIPHWSKLKFILGNPKAASQGVLLCSYSGSLMVQNTQVQVYVLQVVSLVSDTVIVTPQPEKGRSTTL